MSDARNYTAGWICAISTEHAAAQDVLDEEHPGPNYVTAHDHNDYTLGRIGLHNVVIAVLPDGEHGTDSAAGVARDMLHSFTNIRMGLIVGVGNGAPGPSRDIRPGDAAESSPVHEKGALSRMILGKRCKIGRNFEHTRILNQPPTLLRTAGGCLQARHEAQDHSLSALVGEALDESPTEE
jgi:hypothetical protein